MKNCEKYIKQSDAYALFTNPGRRGEQTLFITQLDTIPTINVGVADKVTSAISATGLMCHACYSDADQDACFCKYCGAQLKTPDKPTPYLSQTLAMEGEQKFHSVYYEPTCRYGYVDCIGDPAYIKATYPEWYKELVERGGEFCGNCENGDCYDDEDK